jgi:FMN phosphatase YigB (HAD superfamily)
MNTDPRPKTILLDIDGTILKHQGRLDRVMRSAELLPGTLEKLHEWDQRGYHLILLTGRRESQRAETERQLAALGIYYDHLIMGLGGGVRVLINDLKPGGEEPTAVAVNVPRDRGIWEVSL